MRRELRSERERERLNESEDNEIQMFNLVTGECLESEKRNIERDKLFFLSQFLGERD